ncbi:MAG: glutathione peroxidase [Bdellovibrionia bacterium]
MQKIWILSLGILFAVQSFAGEMSSANPKSFFDFKVKSIAGQEVDFQQYKGKVILVVNTASQCGFTPQLKGLESLYQKYGSQGFVVMAFPSNDFKQDPSENKEILSFAQNEYKTTFPFFEKNPVAGKDKQPVYQFLTTQKPGMLFKDVMWNFEKFLVGRDGKVIERWGSTTKPESAAVTKSIEKALSVSPE